MTPEEKKEILKKTKEWFRSIGKSHIVNTKKLIDIKEFNYNPFLVSYLSYFHGGDCTPENIARTLIYPRVLGTSISTSFGNGIQAFTRKVLSSIGSLTKGFDIEFEDSRDGRTKYAQLKAGPTTINADDVQPLIDKFDDIYRVGKQNGSNANNSDFIVGVIYGERRELSANYKAIERRYDVLIGREFWSALTGDENFYFDIIDACGEVACEADGRQLLEATITELASTSEIQTLSQKLMERK